MSTNLVWTILGIVLAGFVGKQVLSWLGLTRYAPAIETVVNVSVFIAIASLIAKGLQVGLDLSKTLPK